MFIGSTAARFGEKRAGRTTPRPRPGWLGWCSRSKNEIVALDPAGRVNLLEPGWTVTHVPRENLQDKAAVDRVMQTMPLRQLAQADDIAKAALWLSSPTAARHVTGQTITVAGGMEGRVLWE